MGLRFRQVHLDFHTSGDIPGIGTEFDARDFQKRLTEACVDSVTCFSVCHHGFSYHPTGTGRMHPHLDFNLLRAQIDAAHAVGIRVPVYLSVGANDVAAEAHPEWCEAPPSPELTSWGRRRALDPGFRKLCFNTPYLDYLCELIAEAEALFPDGDGYFFDIVLQGQCCCPKCVRDMLEAGLNPAEESDRKRFARDVLMRYYRKVTAAARAKRPDCPVFHNSGHVSVAHPEILSSFSHLELESLPTGGWGYDHFPQSAAYARKTGLEFLGMTGKFHSSWGEFGGLKHPNALRYECAAMIASGAKCSIGDQLHPSGKLDESTYRVIGEAYREVRDKEPFCRDARNLAEVAVIPAEAFGLADTEGDIGVGRLLLEGHFLFDVLHPDMDFSAYRMVICPDAVPVNPALAARLRAYVAAGGKLVLSGDSGVDAGLVEGAEVGGWSEGSRTYILPSPSLGMSYATTPLVMYGACRRLTLHGGESLGDVYDPYFERDFRHFCSHQHAPCRPEPSGCACGVRSGDVLYFAHRVFKLYFQTGAVVLREYLTRAIHALLGEAYVESNLPSLARIAVAEQPAEHRRIVHLLYGNMVKRGGCVPDSAIGGPIEVIEELLPLTDIEFSIPAAKPVDRVTLEPEGIPLPFERKLGRVHCRIDRFSCHRMVAVYDAE